MKKLVTLALACIMATILCVPSLAAYNEDAKMTEIAYMDIDQASEEIQPKILEAREKIIMSQSWVVDGAKGYVYDKDGNVIEEVPQFHDLFPADWEVPVVTAQKEVKTATPQVARDYTDIMVFFHDTLYLEEAPSSSNTPSFTSVDTSFKRGYEQYDLTSIYTEAYCHIGEGGTFTYNVGYTDADTGKSLGLKTRMQSGQYFSMSVSSSEVDEIAVRASMNSSTSTKEGPWEVFVRGFVDIT